MQAVQDGTHGLGASLAVHCTDAHPDLGQGEVLICEAGLLQVIAASFSLPLVQRILRSGKLLAVACMRSVRAALALAGHRSYFAGRQSLYQTAVHAGEALYLGSFHLSLRMGVSGRIESQHCHCSKQYYFRFEHCCWIDRQAHIRPRYSLRMWSCDFSNIAHKTWYLKRWARSKAFSGDQKVQCG